MFRFEITYSPGYSAQSSHPHMCLFTHPYCDLMSEVLEAFQQQSVSWEFIISDLITKLQQLNQNVEKESELYSILQSILNELQFVQQKS